MRLFLLLVFIMSSQILFGQNFEAQVSDKKVGLNDSFEISFTLNASGKSFSAPPFSDFFILRGPSKSSSTSIVNGAMSQQLTYTYVLKPKKIGVFTILPASIKAKGKTIGTQPITIQVEKGSVSKKPNTAYDIVARKVHLVAKVNKLQCYVGEPLVLTYQLYFNLNIRNISQNSIKYSSFWANEIDVDGETKKANYKNEQYNSVVIKQVVLIPQKSGKQTITGLSLDVVASVPTNKRDFFNMMTTESVNYTLNSNNIVIDVLDLPKVGKPESFSGAVGNFSLKTELDKDSIDVNDSFVFSVEVNGSGNLNLLSSPVVEFDDALEVFDPKNSDKIKMSSRGVMGYKKEEYIIVPRNRGVYSLPIVDFNFFNPKTKEYIVLNTNQKTIKVGGARFDNGDVTERSVNKEEISLINEDIRFIKTDYEANSFSKNFAFSVVFYILFFIPFLLILLSVLYKKGYLNNYVSFGPNLFQLVHKRLIFAKKLLEKGDYQQFHSELLDVLFVYVSTKFSIKKATLSIDKIKEVLVINNISKDIVVDYLAVIKRLELYRYSAHEENVKMDDLHRDVLGVISKIEKSK
jgi:hypothetical protein